jgi:MinD superfamily P-loop ATPase
MELAVISGKGGTGKTSLVASFAALAERVVVADCDVDASDLHLVLAPAIVHRETFSGGKRARIRSELCTACGTCEELCRFGALRLDGPGNGQTDRTYRVDPIACEGCGVCVWFCPNAAIAFETAVNGEWFVSETRVGPMIHARLGVAEENSGKLVSGVRERARETAARLGIGLVLIDGPPGIGCPVIASITGVDFVLIVTEPTISGLHDFERVADTTAQIGIPAMVCVNTWDINPAMALQIERRAESRGVGIAGRIRYDRAVTNAQFRGRSVVEDPDTGCAGDIRAVWDRIRNAMSLPAPPPRQPA